MSRLWSEPIFSIVERGIARRNSRSCDESVNSSGLTKTYRMGDVEVQAINGADFVIEPASFVAFVGPSGSSKSTLLNMIGCLDHPTAGKTMLRLLAWLLKWQLMLSLMKLLSFSRMNMPRLGIIKTLPKSRVQ